MSTKQRAVLLTLSDVFAFMAPFAGGAIPATNSVQYANWKRWVALGQQDAANRGFWARTLTPADLLIEAGDEYAVLPDDFFKRNGIYVLNAGDVDWNSPNNASNQKLMVVFDNTEMAWVVRFLGFTPTQNLTAKLWYFANPPIPTDETDEFVLDGEMCGFYALKEHFRTARQPGSLDDCRIEYENRFTELLSLEVLPSPQELLSWGSIYTHTKQSTNEIGYYSGDKVRGGY